jgi:hypothetical protein
MKSLEFIIQQTLSSILREQAPAAPTGKETDNAPVDAEDSPFTPAEEKFLGKFDAYGTRHLGIIYSISDIGIREFITRSGSDLNITPDMLISLMRKKVIKLVPYTGFGRNDDYTIELQLSLDDVKGLGAEDKAKAEAGSTAGGAAGAPPPAPSPGPEVSWVIPYGELIRESKNIVKQLITETTKTKKTKSKIDTDKSRVMQRLPKGYITQLERIIDMMSKRARTANEKQRMVADILDNLSANLNLTDKQIRKSYEFFKNQKRLQESIELTEATTVPDERIKTAGKFWNNMDDALNHFDYDENLYFDTIKKYVNSKNDAIIIDAVGILLKDAASPKDEIAHKFLSDKIQYWSLLDVPITLGGSSIYTLKRVLENQEVHEYVHDEQFSFMANDPMGELDNHLKSNGIGRLSYKNYTNPDNLQWTATTSFFPTYTVTDVYKVIAQLLAPYKTKDNGASDSAKKSTYIKAKIENDKSLYSQNYLTKRQKDSTYKIPADLSKITSITIKNGNSNKVSYKGTWLDSSKFAYVWFKEDTNDKYIYKLYFSGTVIHGLKGNQQQQQWKFNSPTEIIVGIL